MTLDFRRRDLFKAGLATAAAVPARAWAQALDRGFTHSVASGEPGPDSVLLWTRHVPADRGDGGLAVEVAEDAGFTRIVQRGEAVAEAASDHCARVRVTGLMPGKWYYYRFRAAGGETSPVGRTRTLPAGRTARFNIAVFSCSNLPFGHFNAYAHAAERQDIDLVVHLGDYIYEYPRGTYPSAREALDGRIIDPAGEIVTIADYHARYASYRRDRDLAMLHQRFPMISIWDDHEIANDAWKDGAQNHQAETEGPWETRKAAAKKAYWHWLPMSEEPYKAYEIGDLATLIRLDTRIEGRDQQLQFADALKLADDPVESLTRFRDTVYVDPARQLLGQQQEAWLGQALAGSVRAGKRWQVVAQQIIVGFQRTPPNAEESWLGPTAPDFIRERFRAGLLAAKVDMPSFFDSWVGYPAARSRYLKMAQAAGANLVNLAGDTHNAWAFDLVEGGAPAGVDFGVQGTTSPGFESYLRGADPKLVASSLMAADPTLRWCDTQRRGYMTLSLTADAARCDWHLLDTIRLRSSAIAATQAAVVQHGSNRIALV
jgi:alkaline phosphatase D